MIINGVMMCDYVLISDTLLVLKALLMQPCGESHA